MKLKTKNKSGCVDSIFYLNFIMAALEPIYWCQYLFAQTNGENKMSNSQHTHTMKGKKNLKRYSNNIPKFGAVCHCSMNYQMSVVRQESKCHHIPPTFFRHQQMSLRMFWHTLNHKVMEIAKKAMSNEVSGPVISRCLGLGNELITIINDEAF